MRSKPKPTVDLQFAKIIGWCFILASLPIWFFSIDRILNVNLSKNWPLTHGQVIASEVYAKTSPRISSWCIKMSYSYTVHSEFVTSDRVTNSLLSTAACERDEHTARARLARLQPGDRVNVHYNSADSSEAFIYQDDLKGLYISIVVAVALFISGVAATRVGTYTSALKNRGKR